MQNTLPRNPAKKPVGAMEIIGWIAAGIPALLIVGVVVLGLIAPVVMSFMEWNMLQPMESAGLDNYAKLLTGDEVFWIALGNSLMDLLVIGVGGFVLCALVAWALHSTPRPVQWLAVAMLLLPLLCPGMWNQVATMFRSDAYGLVNSWLMQSGRIDSPILFLQTPEYVPHIVRGVQFWRSLGPGVLILCAGLASVRPAVMKECRQRGVTSRPYAFWHITLPRMRIPLMLAAAVMVMGSAGTATVSQILADFTSVDYCARSLWLHVRDYAANRFDIGYGAAIAVVAQAITLATLLLLGVGIFFLTWRPARRRYAKSPAPAETTGLGNRWDAWRIVGMIAGCFVALLICVLPGFMLFREVNCALMPLDELFQFPARIVVQKPTLDNFADVFLAQSNSYVPVVPQILRALLFVAAPMLLTAGIVVLAGFGPAGRRNRAVRVILAAVLGMLVLCSPFVDYWSLMGSGYRYSEIIEFAETLDWVLWAFVPASVLMGLSMGEMLRRKLPWLRLIGAVAAYLCLVLFFCWNGSFGRYVQQMAAGGIARAGITAAGNLLRDMVGLLLALPMVIGGFQLMAGLCDTYPLYRGGNE